MTTRPRGAARPWLPLAPVLLFLAAFMLFPVGRLLLASVVGRDGAPTLEFYQRLFTSEVYFQVLLITLKIAAWTTLFAVLVGYPVAYLIATSTDRWRARLTFWVLLPFWTSFLVRTFAWIVLLGRNGAINQLVQALGLSDAPLELIFNLSSVVIGMSHGLMPLAILTMVAVMETIDRRFVDAALTLGAGRAGAFWRVYFPLSLPGVAAAALMVFITALGFFITPVFLGGRREIVITQVIIEQVQDLLNFPFAGATSMLLLVTALAIFWIYDRVVGLSTLAGGRAAESGGGPRRLERVLGKVGLRLLGALATASDAVAAALGRVFAARAERKRFDWGSALLVAGVVLVLAFLTLPALIMVPISFARESVIDWPPRGFSLAWYDAFWRSPQWMAATTRSLGVATATAVIALLIGTPAAFVLARARIRGKTAILGFILSPLIVPRLVIAVGLFYLFARVGLVGSSVGLVLGHSVLAIPYVVVTVMAVLKTYDDRLDQAAATLGAGRLTTLRRITFPLIRAGLLAAFLFAFVTSFDELTIALFATGGLTTTLPKQMWDDALLRVTPTLAVASTLLLVFVTLLILFAEHLRRQARRV
jgi:ABC-type spermidine/putrescine transport system permease subunit I